MNEDTKKIIAEQMEVLPEDVKKAILSVDYRVQLQEIVKRNHLLIDQAGALETETTLTLLGLEPLENYVENISRELALSKDKAIIVAHDVDELIFKNIRISLQQLNDKNLEENEEIEERTTVELSKENVMSGIENPTNIPEESISISSLKSNSLNPEYPAEPMTKGIEIRREMSLEIPPEAKLPIKSLTDKTKEPEPLHQNTSPANNIVEEKLGTVISTPTEKVVIEENSKLPSKHDPYRESVI
ncbi:MAG: hypothetical protein WC229_03180 [Candidatus Paceibacterota bacterium]|jgi:hypothetical protein